MMPFEHILWEQESDEDYFYKYHTGIDKEETKINTPSKEKEEE